MSIAYAMLLVILIALRIIHCLEQSPFFAVPSSRRLVPVRLTRPPCSFSKQIFTGNYRNEVHR